MNYNYKPKLLYGVEISIYRMEGGRSCEVKIKEKRFR